ncbi:MAG TPA: hypothetical protein VGZ25_13405, partial [Gemmataceae bacterium]|nr:hypothetical protein [Gemmataceae bacterium]
SFGVFRCLCRGSVPADYPCVPKTLASWGWYWSKGGLGSYRFGHGKIEQKWCFFTKNAVVRSDFAALLVDIKGRIQAAQMRAIPCRRLPHN